MLPQKRPEESDLQYHKRLVYGKLVDKTLADEDYAELAPAVYGRDYSSDVCRRMLYGSRYTLDLMEQNAAADLTGTSLLDELDAKKAELQRERQRFYDQRREYNKLVSSDARGEHLEDRLVAAAENLHKTVPLQSTPALATLNDGTEAVLVLTDWHYGMVVDNIWNRYNTEICRQRVIEVVGKSIERLSLFRPEKLHIVLLGDFCHGAIHCTTRVAAEELVCDQLMQVSEILAQTISQLAPYAGHTFVYSTYGNHMRTVQDKKESIHADNMERIIPWWLSQRLRDYDSVTIVPTDLDEFVMFNVCGYNVCAVHGDLDPVKSSPRTLNALFSKRFGQTLDYILLGDRHHLEEYEEFGIESILFRSLCGTDEYAAGKRLFSSAGQTLMFFTPDCGRDATFNIKTL